MSNENLQQSNVPQGGSHVNDEENIKMDDGIIGKDMGISDSSNDQDSSKYSKQSHDGGPSTVPGDTGGGATNGSKAGSALGPDGSVANAASNNKGSATEQ